MDYQPVIPEFVVSDLEQSRHFYCDLIGFSVEYERPEEKFLFLSLEDCQLMLEEGSAEELAQLTYPFSDAVSIFPLALQMFLSSTKNCWKLTIPIHRPLTKREFRVGDSFIYPHEFAVFGIQMVIF